MESFRYATGGSTMFSFLGVVEKKSVRVEVAVAAALGIGDEAVF